MTVNPELESRIEELAERLGRFRQFESELGIDLERPILSLRDGYPENAVTHAGRIVEALLKHIWILKGVSGDPSRKALQDLVNGCKDYLRDRTIRDHIESIQATRNRAGHHGGEVVDEDGFDALRRLSTVLDWFVGSFTPVELADEEGIDEEVRERLEFVVGLYHVLGFKVIERFAFTSRSVYLLMQWQQGIRTEYKELILSEDLRELASVLSSRGTPLFATQYPTCSRLIALRSGRWSDRELPDELRDAEVMRYDDFLEQFLDYRTYRRAATASGAAYLGRRELPAGGQLLRLDAATHEYSCEAVDSAQVLLEDLFLSEGGNVLLVGKPGAGKSEQLRRLFLTALHGDRRRIVFRFDLGEKPRDQSLEGYLATTLAEHFTVPSHAVFPLYAFLSRSGRVRNIFDGIDEACPTGTFSEFMEVFSAIAELLSIESQVIMSSRVAFLEDSPYVRELLDRDALFSDRVVNDVTAVGIDPLRLPNFAVLKLTDVKLNDEPAGHGFGGSAVAGTPLDYHMLQQLSVDQAESVRALPPTSRSLTAVSRFVENCVRASPLALADVSAVFGRGFLDGKERFSVIELFNKFGRGLFPQGLDPAATVLPGLLRPIGEDGVKFHHRVLQEYLAAHFMSEHLDELSEPVRLSEQVRALFHNLVQTQSREDGVVDSGVYLVGPGDSLRLHSIRHPFRVQKDPVTNREYQEFLNAADAGDVEHLEHPRQPASVQHQPAPWRMRDPSNFTDPHYADHPITCISWWSAFAYARWRGGRLLDAVEWECAARGADGRLFPWGDSVDINKANAADYWAGTELLGYDGWKQAMDTGALRKSRSTSVGKFAGNVSPVGARGMVGNVWEWTDTCDFNHARAVICGGSYDNPFRGVRTYSKGVYRLSGVSNVVGFRWGRDL